MADRTDRTPARYPQLHQHHHQQPSKLLPVLTLLPIGGTLLFLAGLTLAATTTCLILTTPIFIICSPVLVPATIAIGLSVTGVLSSGAMGLTALTSLSWFFNLFREARGGANVTEGLDYAKSQMYDVAGQVGEKTRDVGQMVQGKAHEREHKNKKG